MGRLILGAYVFLSLAFAAWGLLSIWGHRRISEPDPFDFTHRALAMRDRMDEVVERGMIAAGTGDWAGLEAAHAEASLIEQNLRELCREQTK